MSKAVVPVPLMAVQEYMNVAWESWFVMRLRKAMHALLMGAQAPRHAPGVVRRMLLRPVL